MGCGCMGEEEEEEEVQMGGIHVCVGVSVCQTDRVHCPLLWGQDC